MKDYQFEELTFWLSFIAYILATHAGMEIISYILAVTSSLNLVAAFVLAHREIKKEKK